MAYFHTLVTSLESVLHYVVQVVHLKGQILIICIFLEEEKNEEFMKVLWKMLSCCIEISSYI